jgi:protein-disulfide isomerase
MAGLRRARRRRTALAGAAVLALFALGVVVFGALGPDEAGRELRALEGVPQRGLVLGRQDAPLVLVEYLEPQCPHCKRFSQTVFPELVERYVATGMLRIELRPLAFMGADSLPLAKALLAAGRQNRAFQLAALLYARQGAVDSWYSEKLLDELAAKAGLDPAPIRAALADATLEATLRKNGASLVAAGGEGTPFFLLGRQRRVEPFFPRELSVGPFAERIEEILEER